MKHLALNWKCHRADNLIVTIRHAEIGRSGRGDDAASRLGTRPSSANSSLPVSGILGSLCVFMSSLCLAVEFTEAQSSHNHSSVAERQILDGQYSPCRFKADSKGWIEKEGVIHLQRKGGKFVSLESVVQYKDFELFFEWRIKAGGNSGVIYRAIDGRGLEYQVVDNGSRHARRPEWSAAAIYDLVTPAENKACQAVGQWNMGRILAVGNHIEHWINGKKVVDYDLGSEDWQRRYQESKYATLERKDFGQTEGSIVLQNHGQPVWYRNVRIRELDPDEWAASEAAEQVVAPLVENDEP